MANNFVNIKENQASRKFHLVKLNPARMVNGDLSLVSGLDYTMTFPYDVVDVVENGSSVSYTHTETTQQLDVTLTAAPSSSNIVVVTYAIYITSSDVKTIGKDPETPGTDLRDWEPRLKNLLSVKQNVKDILNGVFSISNSSITLINNGQYWEQYLTDNDSFYNKEIEVWQVLDEVSNIQKVFKGVISGLSIDKKQLVLRVKDTLDRLTYPALMGDDIVYYTNGNFTKVDPLRVNFPILYHFGTVTRYKLLSESVTNLGDASRIDASTLSQAICTDYNNDITTANNREYHAGRVSGSTDFSFTMTAVDNTDPNFTRLTTSAASIAKLHIGDTFVVTGSGTYYVRILYVDRTNNYVYITKEGSLVLTDTVNSNVCPVITIQDLSTTYYCLYGRDYTASEVALPSGNKLIKVNFVSNFEANHAGLTALDPSLMTVGYRLKPNFDSQDQANVLTEILTKAGFTLDAASFTAAQTSLDVKANFSIPYFDEVDFNDYTKYVEELLQSTIGYILLKNDFTIAYKLFKTPTSADSVTDIDILKDTYQVGFEYKDIVSELITFNSHYSSSEFSNVASVTVDSPKAKYLHGINKTSRFRHYLEDYSTRATDLMAIRSERFAKYSFATKSVNYDSEIGDDILLEKSGLPGQVTSRPLKIISMNKKVNETTVEATDLLDI